jgi:RNA polymerase sigma-70 factor (ECF subfamily)
MAPRFEDLIDRHHKEIFSYLWRLLGNARRSDVALDTEDLVQEVYMRAYEAFSSLRPNSNYRAWLYKIATNCAFTKLRQSQTQREKMTMLTNLPRAGDDSSAQKDLQRQLRIAVDELPAKQKACITLRYLNDLNYPEIAEVVGCSEVSARANVYQAIQRLRSILKEDQ